MELIEQNTIMGTYVFYETYGDIDTNGNPVTLKKTTCEASEEMILSFRDLWQSRLDLIGQLKSGDLTNVAKPAKVISVTPV